MHVPGVHNTGQHARHDTAPTASESRRLAHRQHGPRYIFQKISPWGVAREVRRALLEVRAIRAAPLFWLSSASVKSLRLWYSGRLS